MDRINRVVFENYSYGTSILTKILDIMPPLLRKVTFKLLLGSLGKNTFIDYGVYIRYFNKVHIGSNSEINRGCEIYPSFKLKDSEIVIGNNVLVGPNVVFFGAGQDQSLRRENVGGRIIIEDNVYIGGNSIIRYGVRIGSGSTIAANSCVVKNVPPNSFVRGFRASS